MRNPIPIKDAYNVSAKAEHIGCDGTTIDITGSWVKFDGREKMPPNGITFNLRELTYIYNPEFGKVYITGLIHIGVGEYRVAYKSYFVGKISHTEAYYFFERLKGARL